LGNLDSDQLSLNPVIDDVEHKPEILCSYAIYTDYFQLLQTMYTMHGGADNPHRIPVPTVTRGLNWQRKQSESKNNSYFAEFIDEVKFALLTELAIADSETPFPCILAPNTSNDMSRFRLDPNSMLRHLHKDYHTPYSVDICGASLLPRPSSTTTVGKICGGDAYEWVFHFEFFNISETVGTCHQPDMGFLVFLVTLLLIVWRPSYAMLPERRGISKMNCP
jgi:hypothetical protein